MQPINVAMSPQAQSEALGAGLLRSFWNNFLSQQKSKG